MYKYVWQNPITGEYEENPYPHPQTIEQKLDRIIELLERLAPPTTSELAAQVVQTIEKKVRVAHTR